MRVLAFYEDVGPLSGLLIATSVLIALGVLGTFPTFFGAFASE